MDALTGWIALPLGYIMKVCCSFISDYGVAIIVFTVFTKIILLPISAWVQKNSIKMVQMQPDINNIKAKFFGDSDTIADEQSKLYKRYKYNPLISLIPLVIQIVLLMGVVGVIYAPFDYLFHLPKSFIAALNKTASQISGLPVSDSSIQLTAIDAIKNPETFGKFAALGSQFPSLDVAGMLDSIKGFDITFLGLNLSYIPSSVLGVTVAVPIVAGLSSYFLCFAQNKSNVLQAEQSRLNRWGMLILSVGLSLYLGFFVPTGIALYWVASNLLAIVQLYVLNAVIPPEKYVDYEALAKSRRKLASLNELSKKEKQGRSKQDKKREKADYKKFFSIENKHIVFYSEKSGFYKYYQEIIEGLIKKLNVSVHYVTNDPDDIIFEKAKQYPQIKPYYIGNKKLISLMMKLETDIAVMTTPDLDNFYIKRSLLKKDIEYIFVPHDPSSMHMSFREHALDNFDTVFCTGPHIKNEVRASERIYGTKEKTLVEFGYPLIEKLTAAYQEMPVKKNTAKKQILIAPSWQEDNLLDSCINELIDTLYGEDYRIIVRPHPEYVKRYAEKLNLLIGKYVDKIGDNLQFELDFSSSVSVYSSDLMITDWSGIGIEFCFSTLNPILFVNTKIKAENPNYEKIGIVPQEIRLRTVLGKQVEKSEISGIKAIVDGLLCSADFNDNILRERAGYFYNFGSGGQNGVNYITDRLLKKAKENKK